MLVSDQSSFFCLQSPTELLLHRACFLFMRATIRSERLKGSGKRSVPLIKASSLWVVTRPDRGSAPDLLMRTLQRGSQYLSVSLSLSLWADTGFSVGGVAPPSINIFPIKCLPLIHLAAHSALYKASQCFYCKSWSRNPACWELFWIKKDQQSLI